MRWLGLIILSLCTSSYLCSSGLYTPYQPRPQGQYVTKCLISVLISRRPCRAKTEKNALLYRNLACRYNSPFMHHARLRHRKKQLQIFYSQLIYCSIYNFLMYLILFFKSINIIIYLVLFQVSFINVLFIFCSVLKHGKAL